MLKVKPALPPKLLPSLNCTCVFDPPGVPLPEPALSSSQTTLPDESVVSLPPLPKTLQSVLSSVMPARVEVADVSSDSSVKAPVSVPPASGK